MATSIDNAAWLQWMATLMGGSRQTCAATFPADRFYCLLDELPLHLVPQNARQSLQVKPDQFPELVLNPECRMRPAQDLPEELGAEKELVSGFALQATIAWVRDTKGGRLLPFWLGPKLEEVLRQLRPGEPVASSLPADLQALLYAAEILLPEDRKVPLFNHGEELIRKAGVEFQEKGYAPLGGLIHPFHIAGLRRYYRQRIRTGKLQLGDRQSDRRYVDYNDPVARFFHREITARLSKIAGESLKPSYVYLASYLSGAELKKHTDREQCDYSVTLCLDYSPEPTLATPWPIQLETPTGTVAVYQAIGDGLAYRGTRLPHCRGKLQEGQTSTSIFFHYVRQDFAGSLE